VDPHFQASSAQGFPRFAKNLREPATFVSTLTRCAVLAYVPGGERHSSPPDRRRRRRLRPRGAARPLVRGRWLDRWGNAITVVVLGVIGALVLADVL
jgi:hypothetical protein